MRRNKMLWAGLTYSGHALACAAGLATLEVYEQDGLIENAAMLGEYLGRRLEEIKAKHPSVGDVRYIGLFSALEIVKSKETKEPVDPLTDIAKFLRENGLFTFIFHNLLFVVPPLCITQEQLDEGLEIIERSVQKELTLIELEDVPVRQVLREEETAKVVTFMPRGATLDEVLDAFAVPGNHIYAVFPERRLLPAKVRLFIDHLKQAFGDPPYWER